MYRYYVFVIDSLYPAGGLDDIRLKTNDLKMAQSWLKVNGSSCDYCYIYDWLEDKRIGEG